MSGLSSGFNDRHGEGSQVEEETAGQVVVCAWARRCPSALRAPRSTSSHRQLERLSGETIKAGQIVIH